MTPNEQEPQPAIFSRRSSPRAVPWLHVASEQIHRPDATDGRVDNGGLHPVGPSCRPGWTLLSECQVLSETDAPGHINGKCVHRAAGAPAIGESHETTRKRKSLFRHAPRVNVCENTVHLTGGSDIHNKVYRISRWRVWKYRIEQEPLNKRRPDMDSAVTGIAVGSGGSAYTYAGRSDHQRQPGRRAWREKRVSRADKRWGDNRRFPAFPAVMWWNRITY